MLTIIINVIIVVGSRLNRSLRILLRQNSNGDWLVSIIAAVVVISLLLLLLLLLLPRRRIDKNSSSICSTRLSGELRIIFQTHFLK